MILHGSPAQTADLANALGAVILERRPFPYRSTFPLEELSVQTPDGVERSVVFKDLSRQGPTDPVWRIKAPFLHDPLREMEVYRDVLGPDDVSAPACAGLAIKADLGRYWLFLEKVEGELLWQIGDMEVWQRAAEWLADLHSSFADRMHRLPLRLVVHDREYHQRWIQRAKGFARPPGSSNGSGDELDWLAERCQQAVDWLIEQPVTFLHGEFYPSNIIVESSADGARIRPVDWEMAATGPGIVDLAALTSGAWDEAEREMMALAYLEALPTGLRPSPESLKEGLDRCRLLLAIQWLGWSTDWTPPPEHTHDWMATAIQLAEGMDQ